MVRLLEEVTLQSNIGCPLHASMGLRKGEKQGEAVLALEAAEWRCSEGPDETRASTSDHPLGLGEGLSSWDVVLVLNKSWIFSRELWEHHEDPVWDAGR